MAMFLARPSESRGKADFDWLRTRYTFSFAAYYDPHYMGFRSLRVLNQDCVAPQKGFPMHAHTDMEILTLVLQGTVEHRDSLGHTRKIRAGQAQRMSAGSGVQHSESNPSPHEELQLLQIWIEPAELGLRPSYEEAEISSAKNRLNLVAGPKAAEAPLTLNQDAWLYRRTRSRHQPAAGILPDGAPVGSSDCGRARAQPAYPSAGGWLGDQSRV